MCSEGDCVQYNHVFELLSMQLHFTMVVYCMQVHVPAKCVLIRITTCMCMCAFVVEADLED